MNTQIQDEAAEWLIELQTEELDTGMRERFCTWLDTSPEHVRAYLEIISLWDDASNIDRRGRLDLGALIDAAKAERNIFPFEVARAGYLEASGALQRRWMRKREMQNRPRWRALAAAAALAGVCAICTGYWQANLRGLHSTQIGEQRTLALKDGTTVELNAGTRIRERFTDSERAVDLLEGQALFRVARNAGRPFVVRTESVTVRAVGTQFDVHRQATGMTVTVLEGRVAVGTRPDAARSVPQQEVLLDVGDQLRLNEGNSTAVSNRADLKLATAWTQQRLAFESANLRDVAAEFNRFNERQLIVVPKGIEDFKVSGTFPALDPASLQRFVQFLREQPGLAILESHDSITVEKKNR